MSDDSAVAGSPSSLVSLAAAACPGSTLSLDAMGDIAAGLARVDRAVTLGDGPTDSPRSLRLIATESYDVWLVTWPPGSGIEEHDHGDAVSVMHMVSGCLVEEQAGKVRPLTADTSAATAPHGPHRLWNPLPQMATSIHVYSPPLKEMTYWSTLVTRALHPAGSGIESRPRPIRHQPAEASTKRPEAHDRLPGRTATNAVAPPRSR